LLPDAFAGFGRHRPGLLVDTEGDLLEVFLSPELRVPGSKDLCPVPTTTEPIGDLFYAVVLVFISRSFLLVKCRWKPG